MEELFHICPKYFLQSYQLPNQLKSFKLNNKSSPTRLTLSLIQQFCSRRLLTYFVKNWKISLIEYITYGKRRNCNFFFRHYVFKKPSAAEASESLYIRERVNWVHMWKTVTSWPFMNRLDHICICTVCSHIIYINLLGDK